MNEFIKMETAVGAFKLEIELDAGFFGSDTYEWGSEFLHNHAVHEVHLVERGHCVMHVDKREYIMEAPSLCVIPPGMYHAQFSVRPGEVGKTCFRFFVLSAGENERTVGGRAGAEASGQPGKVLANLPLFVSPVCGEICEWVGQIRRELERDRWGSRMKVQALFTALLIDIARLAPDIRPMQSDEAANQSMERRTERIDLYFASRYHSDPNEAELASLLHVSTRQLNRILNTRYGVSFRQKLMETRIHHAMDLLLRSSLSISDIAARVGYESARSFHAAFKSYTCYTPAAYRAAASRD